MNGYFAYVARMQSVKNENKKKLAEREKKVEVMRKQRSKIDQ